MEEINEKVEELNAKIGLETLSFERFEAISLPGAGKPARLNRNMNGIGRQVAPPPAPAKAPRPAQIAKPAKAPAAPQKPPLPPAKK